MPLKAPEALRGQARTFVAAADAAARWFRRPDPAALSAARAARLRARGWRVGAVSALKGARGPAHADAADLSFALREAVEHAVSASSDAARWDVGPDAVFATMAKGLARGARALVRAVETAGAARAEALDETKRWCADVERRRRVARADALDSVHFVEAVKRSEIAARLSSAAEALQQAGDALAGSLSE
jgi:hypothetical protein